MAPRDLNADAAEQQVGLVFSDRSGEPRCHVLVIGAGSYPWSDFPEISSPPASARAIADWFLGFAPTGYANPKWPLGSVAILLSDAAPDKDAARAADAAPALYRGAPTLRPTREAVNRAVEAWAGRLQIGDLAFLYVCGHGMSNHGQSLFVLEDHGRDPNRPLRGLIDIDNFFRMAQTQRPRAQMLFFDCCRSRTPLRIAPGAQLNEQPLEQGVGDPIKVEMIALFSTALDADAGGRVSRPSLFAASLLMALEIGAARVGRGWVVRPGAFWDALTQCLALFRHESDDLQRPVATFAAPAFEINRPVFDGQVRTFISLADPTLWDEATIKLVRIGAGGREDFLTLRGAEQADPFVETRLERGEARYEVRVDVGANSLMAELAEIAPPAQFIRLPDDAATVSAVEPPASRGLPDSLLLGERMRFESLVARQVEAFPIAAPDEAHFAIQVAGPHAFKGAVVTLDPLDSEDETLEMVATIGGDPLRFATPLGRYAVSAALPDGRRLRVIVNAREAKTYEVTLAAGASPREYLQAATVLGAARADAASEQTPARETAALEAPIQARAILPPSIAAPAGVADEAFSGRLALVEDHAAPRRFGLIAVEDALPVRFRCGEPDAPLWIEASLGDRRALCAVPSIGRARGWRAEIAIDRERRGFAAGVVASEDWTGLLGHLARRDHARAALVLKSLRDGGLDPFALATNPLAQIAAGLIVAATAGSQPGPDDEAIRTMAARYRGLPDAPIVLARRLWALATDEAGRQNALALFREGFYRGAPVFSPALDWLVDGLAALGRDAEDVGKEARAAAELRRRVDPNQCFVAVRLA